MEHILDKIGLTYFWGKIKATFAKKSDIPAASTTVPVIDGVATVGSSTAYARADHKHPIDNTRAPLLSPSFTGTPTAPTAETGNDTTQIATTAFVKAAITAGNPIKAGDFILNNLAANINNIKKELYINNVNDRLYAADKRFYVTHKVFEIDGGTLVKNLSTNVFIGNTEQYKNTITEAQYAELYIGSEPEDALGTDNSVIWTYGGEFVYLTFYTNRYPDAISEAKVYYKQNNLGWVNCDITKISDCVYQIFLKKNTYLSAIKIKWLGSSSHLVSLSDVKAFAGRSTLQSESIVSKHPIKQDLWGEVEAPKFIKRGGTSSQFLKADGSVDETSYISSTIVSNISYLTEAQYAALSDKDSSTLYIITSS